MTWSLVSRMPSRGSVQPWEVFLEVSMKYQRVLSDTRIAGSTSTYGELQVRMLYTLGTHI